MTNSNGVSQFVLHNAAVVEEERLAYNKRRDLAIRSPEQYLSVIQDDMTTFTTSYPHFRHKTKSNDSGQPVAYTLTGSIVHGHGIVGHLTRHEWGKHKSNVACEALLDVLRTVVEDRGYLPDTLFFQADNYAGSNKNHVMFGFLGKLIELGVFKRIEVTHSHIDISRKASIIADCRVTRYKKIPNNDGRICVGDSGPPSQSATLTKTLTRGSGWCLPP